GAFGAAAGGFGAGATGGLAQTLASNQRRLVWVSVRVQQQAVLTASVDQRPYGQTPLFDLVPDSVVKSLKENPLGARLLDANRLSIHEEATRAAAAATSSLTRMAPSQVTRNKLRMAGFHETSSFSKPNSGAASVSSTFSSSVNGTSDTTASARLATPRSGLGMSTMSESGGLPPSVFTPRASAKKVDWKQVYGSAPAGTSKANDGGFAVPRRPGAPAAAADESMFATSRAAPETPAQTPSKPPRAGVVTRGLAPPSILPAQGYEVSPVLTELQAYSPAQLSAVRNLTITHHEHGKVEFLEPVDLTGIKLTDLCGKYVSIVPGELLLYADVPANQVPVEGQGLKVKCRVTLRNKFPRSKATRQAMVGLPADDPTMQTFVARLKKAPGTVFESYDGRNGVWTF
ncbi:nucleoporin autopeptidase-domain-containing protein, partial [Catenaria anguillulae PL171]